MIRSNSLKERARTLRAALLLLALPLMGCQSSLEIDLGVASPPKGLQRLELSLAGVELRDEAGNVVRLDVEDRRPFDLLADGPERLRRIVSASDVSERRYTGLKLLFDEKGGEAEFEDGREVPVVLSQLSGVMPLDLKLEREEDGHAQVMLDLLFSLADRQASLGHWILRPAGSATDVDVSSGLSGDVTQAFARREGCETDRGYAFYLFQGERTIVDDFDDDDSAPPLRSARLEDREGDVFRYRFAGVPAGRYTLAYTCQADQDDPLRDDAIIFRDLTVVDLRARRETERDF